MPRPRGVEQTILEHVGVFEVVRRSSLHLLPHHQVTINNTIREMLADGLLKEIDKGHNKHYILTPKGKEQLRESEWMFYEHEFLPANVRSGNHERLMLAADAAILLGQADLGIFSWDRMIPRYLKPEHMDMFYPADEIKSYLADGPLTPALRYSRLTGLLLTQDAPYRIYHVRDVAPEIRRKGENDVRTLLQAKLYPNIAQTQDRVLFIGDKNLVSPGKIMHNTLFPNNTANKLRALEKKKGTGRKMGELLTASMLGYPSYFISLTREAIPLLRLHACPGGLEFAQRDAIGQIVGDASHLKRSQIMYQVGDMLILYAADLNLSAIVAALRDLKGLFRRGMSLSVYCLDWQQAFWEEFMQKHYSEGHVSFITSGNSYIESVVAHLNSVREEQEASEDSED